jgi:beta-carotene hydroxylase
MKELLASPRVAWPTVALLAVAFALWLAGIALVDQIWWLGTVLATLGAYIAFTPMHEAAHRSLAARWRWVNGLAGRLATIPLFGPFLAVRYVHLEHHKHTNDPVADPDHWSGRGPSWLLPLRWLTQDVHYYVVYLRRGRPWHERIEVVGTLGAFIAIAIALTAAGHGRIVLLGWLVPARLAIGVLAFAFDYLPHRPHTVTAKQDRFAATSMFEGRLAYIASLGQSMHRVHHLYPGVPFYRYGDVFRAGLATPRRTTSLGASR